MTIKQTPLDRWVGKVLDKIELDVKQVKRRFIRPKTQDVPELKRYVCAVDVDRMDQVFSNLLHNAVKHTSMEDGEIAMSMQMDADASELMITFRDNGEGIDKEMLPFIFDRFYKVTKGESDGSGLGLAIVKEIIKLHQGRIWVDSPTNKGSAFTVALPVWLKKD